MNSYLPLFSHYFIISIDNCNIFMLIKKPYFDFITIIEKGTWQSMFIILTKRYTTFLIFRQTTAEQPILTLIHQLKSRLHHLITSKMIVKQSLLFGRWFLCAFLLCINWMWNRNEAIISKLLKSTKDIWTSWWME